MIKQATFAALTLLATLTAVQAAIQNAAPSLPPFEARLQTVSLSKAKMPPRRSLGAADTATGIGLVQFD